MEDQSRARTTDTGSDFNNEARQETLHPVAWESADPPSVNKN